jgi:predicted transcriptional regulator
MDISDLIPTKEAAAILGVTPRMVRYYISTGNLSAHYSAERYIMLSREQVVSFSKRRGTRWPGNTGRVRK